MKFGSVSKTSDGGKTWSVVLTTDLLSDYIYFNGISCGTELNCVVVGEGDDSSGGYRTVAYSTFDGGKSWELTLNNDNFSLMGVKFISDTEVWLAGSIHSGRHMYGQFYYSSDGGKSYTLAQVSES